MLQAMLDVQVITYDSPTRDHTFKEVFLHTLDQGNNRIGLELCKVLLKIVFPMTVLVERGGGVEKRPMLKVQKIEREKENVRGLLGGCGRQ